MTTNQLRFFVVVVVNWLSFLSWFLACLPETLFSRSIARLDCSSHDVHFTCLAQLHSSRRSLTANMIQTTLALVHAPHSTAVSSRRIQHCCNLLLTAATSARRFPRKF